MEPKAANVARAAAMLSAMGVDEGDAPEVTREVRATDEELDAQQVLSKGERTTRVHEPSKGNTRLRNVLGRFEQDGTPKAKSGTAKPPSSSPTPPKMTKEVRTMARAATKTPPPAAAGEREETTEVEAAPGETPAPAKTRAEAAREKLVALRAGREAKAKATAARVDLEAQQRAVQAQRGTLEQQLAAAEQERAKWEAARRTPLAGMKALGLDATSAFQELAEAAKAEGTPEAQLASLRAHYDGKIKSQDEKIEALLTQLADRDSATLRAQAETEFVKVATKEAYPHAHAYINAEAKRQGVDAHALWMKAADAVAEEQRAKGHTPSYKSIADKVEEYCEEVILELLAGLPPEIGGRKETATTQKTSPEASTAPETKGKSKPTIGNEVASSRISSNARRLSLAERQKKAERFLG